MEGVHFRLGVALSPLALFIYRAVFDFAFELVQLADNIQRLFGHRVSIGDKTLEKLTPNVDHADGFFGLVLAEQRLVTTIPIEHRVPRQPPRISRAY